MKMLYLRCHFFATFIAILGCLSTSLAAQESQPYLRPSIERAQMYMQHGLPDDAKRMAIALIFDTHNETIRLDAKMFLAHIAVHEGRMDDATEIWREVITQNAGSLQADEARQLIPIATELRSHVPAHFAETARAELYFAAARLWSSRSGYNRTFLPIEDAAGTWLNKLVEEFPGSRDAERAMRLNAEVLLGGLATVLPSNSRSVEEQERYNRLLGSLRKVMGRFQQKFPDSPYLSHMQYRIADTFFGAGRKVDAEPWLREIREREGGMTFWKQIAQLRDQYWSGR